MKNCDRFLLGVATVVIPFSSTFIALGQGLPAGLCKVACNGGSPVPAFDFKNKGSAYGKDPFTGSALGAGGTIHLPEPNDANQSDIPAESAYGQYQDVENWSASQCGNSLATGGDETIWVYVPCASDAIKNRWSLAVISGHIPGIKAPNKAVGDAFYNAASSDDAQEKLKVTRYIRLGIDGTKPKPINSESCGEKDLFEAGDRSLFSVGMGAKACRRISVSAPTKNLHGTNYWYEDGLPADATVSTDVNSSVYSYIFGKQFVLIGASGSAAGPQTGNASTQAYFTKLGETVAIFAPSSGVKLNTENTYDIGQYSKGAQATFAIGPIPITVEGGFVAKAKAYAAGWAAKMWAGIQTKPFVDASAYAKAYVNLFVVKGGVEGTLQLVYDDFTNHAASLSAVVPRPEVGNQDTFIYSYQISGENHFKSLSGRVDAFAKVMVPKFIGIRWKRYGMKLFDWTGVSADGYLYSDMKNNIIFTAL